MHPDTMEMELWLTKHKPTICPPCGEGKRLPHYDDVSNWKDQKKRAFKAMKHKKRMRA